MFRPRRIVQALVAAALSVGLVLGSSTTAMAGPCGGEGEWASPYHTRPVTDQ